MRHPHKVLIGVDEQSEYKMQEGIAGRGQGCCGSAVAGVIYYLLANSINIFFNKS